MNKKTIKIVFSGLDNAGKTSMLVGFKRMYGFEEEIHNLKPTSLIDYYNRDFLNLQLNFFDMGGQRKFREMYLKRQMYFESCDLLIYLIDIQDEFRYSESIQYLENVLNVLKKTEYSNENPIYLCFSKADYEMIMDNPEDYLSKVKMVKELLEKSFPANEFEFYSTSIYNLYTIIRMISNGLRNSLENFKEIQDIINNFGKISGIEQALLFDHTGLVISETFDPKTEGLEFQNKIDKIISGHLGFFGQLEEENLEITSIRGVDGQFMNLCYQFHLYNDLELTEDEIKNISKKKEEKDPFYANYYFSIIATLKECILAENQIPKILVQLQDQLKTILVK